MTVAKAAPYVIQNLTDLEVNISGKIILECKVSGTPEPQITWRKNGYPISAASGERYLLPERAAVLYGTQDNELARLPQPWDLQPHSDRKNGWVRMVTQPQKTHTEIQIHHIAAAVSSLDFEVEAAKRLQASACLRSLPSAWGSARVCRQPDRLHSLASH